jgi:hypothetical protein
VEPTSDSELSAGSLRCVFPTPVVIEQGRTLEVHSGARRLAGAASATAEGAHAR